jgi:hypothetical protein
MLTEKAYFSSKVCTKCDEFTRADTANDRSSEDLVPKKAGGRFDSL